MASIIEVCKQFSSFHLVLEIGPWKDDGSGVPVESLLVDGVDDSVSSEELVGDAQLGANERKCKVILSVYGDHKETGMTRIELGVFYPQIKTEFRKPKSVHLQVKAPASGIIDNVGDDLSFAKESLINWVLDKAKVSYSWENGVRTRVLIPEPPEGHSLFVVLVQPSRNRVWEVQEEYLVAVHDSKRPIFRSTIGRTGEFVCLEDDADNAKLPAGSYIHNGDCWVVINPQCWWALNS